MMVLFAFQTGCNPVNQTPAPTSFPLQSTSLVGDTIPRKFSSCKGETNLSPELSWNSPPPLTQSLALIVTDKDSYFGFGGFVHWVLYDLPAGTRELPEDLPRHAQLPDGTRQGPNAYDEIGYLGPCPPGHSAHRYEFELFALDVKLNLPPGATKKQVMRAMDGHVLATGQLVGQFQH